MLYKIRYVTIPCGSNSVIEMETVSFPIQIFTNRAELWMSYYDYVVWSDT